MAPIAVREFTYLGTDGHPLHALRLGQGPLIVMLHGGGPDHRSLLPMARRFFNHTTVLPDIRGYGRSICVDPAGHTWGQYAADVISLMDHLDVGQAVLVGTGLGGTITLRAAQTYPDRIRAAVVIGAEDIEDDEAKRAETELFDDFARRVRAEGLAAAWEPLLEELVPLIGNLVREAMGRADPASVAAAAAIGHDRAFVDVRDLQEIDTPTLIIPGADPRHPTALGERLSNVLRKGALGPSLSVGLRTADDLADAVVPAIQAFLGDVHR
ncbi:alpha/beta fold hydrolase [Actinokineospora sp. HUAS TT18]|uniref:alpha/beta fold hydrolase n=1 Tax=Actinokineospora sp. HUAS TT18 TaxID=3447451 RepID=UPI003F52381D